MLNRKQREERDALQDRRDNLREDLAFAQSGKKPWRHKNWTESRGTDTCDRHGEYQICTLTGPEYRGVPAVINSRCPSCMKAELAQVESGLRTLHVTDLLDEAGIARRFEDCEFDNYLEVNPTAAKNLAACRRYADNWPEVLESGMSLVLSGSCGTGKNHLAVSIAKNIIRTHLARVEITDVMRLTRAVKSTWRHDADISEESVLEHYSSLDLLIIDEVGVQFGSSAEMAILHEVISARYESILPTILISNLPFEQLKEFISPRVADRVTEGERNHLAFNWPSFRGSTRGCMRMVP